MTNIKKEIQGKCGSQKIYDHTQTTTLNITINHKFKNVGREKNERTFILVKFRSKSHKHFFKPTIFLNKKT